LLIPVEIEMFLPIDRAYEGFPSIGEGDLTDRLAVELHIEAACPKTIALQPVESLAETVASTPRPPSQQAQC